MSLISRWKGLNHAARIVTGLAALVILLEFLFDIVEITIGHIMLWTNDKRPKIGRLWIEEERDQTGRQQASTHIDSVRLQPAYERYIHSLDDLAAYVAFKSGFDLSREEFLALYRSLPGQDAGRLVEPEILSGLAEAGSWASVKLERREDKLQLNFFDPYGQPLHTTQIVMLSAAELMQDSRLEDNPVYAGRTIPAPLFVTALESLPQNLRLQVINDPQKWQEWRQRLIAAAVAPRIVHGSVTIALEIVQAGGVSVQEMEASELAVEYLINALNELSPDTHYSSPNKEDEHE
ncbi:MAG TPA: hypothetical protein PKM23_14995 [bacterium]|nr:hypothetical protein [bacterium]